MEMGYRTLLPRNIPRPVTEANARSGNGTGPESKLVSAVCEPCRRKKCKCDRERPSCTRCDKQGTECVYITNAGETRSSAFKRKYNSLEEELDTLRALFSYVQTRPQSEAPKIMSVIQLCQDPAEAIQLFLTQGDGATEIEEFAEAEVSESFIAPTCSEAHPFLTKHVVHVQARPWTTVAGDIIVSQIISQFFIDERPLALPIVDFTVFVREMTQGDPDSAIFCSPLLVNAICAHQCYLSTHVSVWSTVYGELGQLFLEESYKLLLNTKSRASLPMAQAVNLLYQAELAKDVLNIAVAT